MVSKQTFSLKIKELEMIFNHQLTEEQFTAYYEHLKDIFTDDEFAFVVKKIIDEDDRFPSVAAFRRKPRNLMGAYN